jgi:hypothetical protein
MRKVIGICGCLVLAALIVSGRQQQQKDTGPSADTIQPYRPVGRDPFKKNVIKSARGSRQPKPVGFPPLEVRRAEFQQKLLRAQAAGLPEPDPLTQYLVSELDVLGIFRDEHGPGAFLRAQPTGTTFFARRGARCFNGEILRIEESADLSGSKVVFREISYIEMGKKQIPQERVVAKVATAQNRPSR